MPHDSDRLLAFPGRHRDRDGLRKLAADMDQRVRQITARVPQISDRALIDQMVAFLPGLHQIWTMTSQQMLENLCNEYVGFYRYAQAMEVAFEAERQKPRAQQPSGTIQPLPERVKTMVTEALAQSATMEREMQCLADRLRRHEALGIHMDTKNFYADLARAADIGDQHKRWVAELDQVADAAREARVQPGAWQPLVEVFSAVNERIGKLMAIALAVNGAAKARHGADAAAMGSGPGQQ